LERPDAAATFGRQESNIVRTIRIPFARPLAANAAAVVLAGGLAACGGSSSTGSATGSVGAGQAAPTGQRTGQRFDPAIQQKIAQCLQAAGIAVPTFTGRPSGFPTGDRPSGSPTRTRPSGTRTGGFGGQFADPKVRAALQACGITLPTRPPGAGGGAGGAGGGAAPTASPTA
jgi:hypothetical protein